MSKKNTKRVNSYDDLQYLRDERDRLQRILTDEKEAERFKLLTPAPIRINPPSPILTEILNIPIPGQSEQPEKYDSEGLPPTPGSNISNTTKSSRNRTPAKNKKKEIKEITPQIINARYLPIALPQSVQTFTSLNPQAKRRITTKFTKKSKGGKNKTKKRKTKKTKKNKKTKK